MDLKQLDYFRHVAELGSFTRAASFLSVVQPVLSRQVRQLEVELGQNLFERNGRGVVLTDAGSRLLEHTAESSPRSEGHARNSRSSAMATLGISLWACRRASVSALRCRWSRRSASCFPMPVSPRSRSVDLHSGVVERRPRRLCAGLQRPSLAGGGFADAAR